jgi:hypothetical protein
MTFSMPVQWYHSHADPIWPDGTFYLNVNHEEKSDYFIQYFGSENTAT